MRNKIIIASSVALLAIGGLVYANNSQKAENCPKDCETSCCEKGKTCTNTCDKE